MCILVSDVTNINTAVATGRLHENKSCVYYCKIACTSKCSNCSQLAYKWVWVLKLEKKILRRRFNSKHPATKNRFSSMFDAASRNCRSKYLLGTSSVELRIFSKQFLQETLPFSVALSQAASNAFRSSVTTEWITLPNEINPTVQYTSF